MPGLGDPPDSEPVVGGGEVIADPVTAEGFGYAGDGARSPKWIQNEAWSGRGVSSGAGTQVAVDCVFSIDSQVGQEKEICKIGYSKADANQESPLISGCRTNIDVLKQSFYS